MTKCDLTYEELVEKHNCDETRRKECRVIWSVVAGMIVAALAHMLGTLARLGVIAACDILEIAPPLPALYIQLVVAATWVIIGYVIYHVAVTILYTYEEELESYADRWKRFRKFERTELEMEGELP